MNKILFLASTVEKELPITSDFWKNISTWAINTGIKIVISILIVLVTFRIISKISRKIEKMGELEKYDKTLMRTLAYVVNIGVRIIVCICVIDYLGINTSALSALLASLGLCAGLAINGALSNLAGSAMIIITRPFRIDDVIEAQGISGVVEDIHMVCTKIRTFDNKVVYIPNGTLINGNIINYSEKDTRRVDFTFSIAYSNDFEMAKSLIVDICNHHQLVLSDPEPFVRVSEHGASSINIVTRVWVKTEDYWTVNFDILEAVKKAFDENGIEIPFDQLDVHVKNK